MTFIKRTAVATTTCAGCGDSIHPGEKVHVEYLERAVFVCSIDCMRKVVIENEKRKAVGNDVSNLR